MNDYLLLLPDKPIEETESGLALAPGAIEAPNTATVIAYEFGTGTVGGGLVGRRVMHAKYSGTELELDGVKYALVRYKDILGVYT